jgi:glucosamine--fructose-6-phosphate aminotransferase (isomerizing)
MCGIVGAVANRDVVPFLVDGLKRLEYRGYDSAGVAVLSDELRRVRRTGRVVEMETAAQEENLHGFVGIGHTRWATHGGVTEGNAHPHISSGELALVHNGIIENHEQLRERLRGVGYIFESQTDTEVIGHLIHHFLKIENDLLQATQCAVKELQGAYAIAVISKQDPQRLVAARMGCPLLVGLGEGENFIASDASAVISATRNIIFLEEGDVVEVRLDGVSIFDTDGNPIERTVHHSEVSLASMELGP